MIFHSVFNPLNCSDLHHQLQLLTLKTLLQNKYIIYQLIISIVSIPILYLVEGLLTLLNLKFKLTYFLFYVVYDFTYIMEGKNYLKVFLMRQFFKIQVINGKIK